MPLFTGYPQASPQPVQIQQTQQAQQSQQGQQQQSQQGQHSVTYCLCPAEHVQLPKQVNLVCKAT